MADGAEEQSESTGEDRLQQLRLALLEYGNHQVGCPRWLSFSSAEACTCGYHEVLGGPCPSCLQYGDRERTKRRLREEAGLTDKQAEEFIDGFGDFEL